MPMTMQHNYAVAHADDFLNNHPDWIPLINEVGMKIRSGFYDKNWVDILCQYDWHHRLGDMADCLFFAKTWGILTADTYALAFEVGVEPSNDKDIAHNNSIFTKELKDIGIEGEFYGGAYDEDGVIRLTRPLPFSRCNTDIKETKDIMGSFSFEVGTQSIEKTWCQFTFNSGKLARWPYGSKFVTLLCVDPDSMKLNAAERESYILTRGQQ